MIPKLIHYVWVGGPLPESQKQYIKSWKETNPDFEIIRWDEQNIDMSSPLIQRAYQQKKWAKVADIARLQAVAKLGGIYLDTDFMVFKSLSPLLQYKCFCAFQESEHTADSVCNGVFGAEPGHWFIQEALTKLLASRPNRVLPERPTQFGPKHITKLLRHHGLASYTAEGATVKDIFITPVPVFFPFSASETFTPECVTDMTLAAHFWAKSWEGTIPAPIRYAKRLVRPLKAAAVRTSRALRANH